MSKGEGILTASSRKGWKELGDGCVMAFCCKLSVCPQGLLSLCDPWCQMFGMAFYEFLVWLVDVCFSGGLGFQ